MSLTDSESSFLGDRRPQVGKRVRQHGLWLFAGLVLAGGVGLFSALETRRATISAPALAPSVDDTEGVLSSPQDLAIPYNPPTPSPVVIIPQATPAPVAKQTSANDDFSRRYFRAPRPYQPVAPTVPAIASPTATPTPSGPEIVYQAGQAPKANPSGNQASATKGERVEAARFANPATTIPKGTVVQAVLESALDSTRAGFARAIISRDVYSFDGTRVLIQRGSRLIGEYKSDLAQGQKRALIEWQRLMRPDGVIINLDSPSADPLGRAGVKGKVNGHFMERFGGAMMQSALNIGQQAAINSIAAGTSIYAYPLTSQTANTLQQDKVVPTLTVRQGTSISVFVARDLDFTAVEK